MACGNGCNGYYQCGCDILKMKDEIKQMEERTELLQYRIKERVAEFNRVNEGKVIPYPRQTHKITQPQSRHPMKLQYKCNVCFKRQPCSLEFENLGDVPPTLCPFQTKPMATANWKLQKRPEPPTATLAKEGESNV